MMKRVWWWVGVLGAGVLVAGWRAPVLQAHEHVANHLSWGGMNPVYDDNEKAVPVNTVDRTFLAKPIRVDLDAEAPGPHEQRAVRLHVRALKEAGKEDTVAWEAPLFASEQAMVRFRNKLERLASAPIISVRVRVIEDRESPAWNRRWRATEMPYWAETPIY